jgi:urease accessory protein
LLSIVDVHESISQPSTQSDPTCGCGAICVVDTGERSVVTTAYARSPLKLLVPRNHGRAAWIYTSTYGGGLVDGDHIALHVDVGQDAALFLSTQAATKVYRSAGGTKANVYATVAARGLLVAAPDPIVCFAGARYEQTQDFELVDDGSIVLMDSFSSGRRAFGERWAFEEYVSRIRIRRNGRLYLHDAVALRAADGNLAIRMGRFDALGLVALVGTALGAHIQTAIAKAARSPVTRRPDQLVAVTPLGDLGCVIRILGQSMERVAATMRDLACSVPTLLGDDPWTRKW